MASLRFFITWKSKMSCNDKECIICGMKTEKSEGPNSDFCSQECAYYHSERIEKRYLNGNQFFGFLYINHTKAIQ
jgi:hypothetical protein